MNFIDKAIKAISPERALKREVAKKRLSMINSGYGNYGARNILHVMNRERIGQVRGVPFLAPVIDTIKQLGRYTEAEVLAAVINGLFTVFIEKESASDDVPFGESIPEEMRVDQEDENSIELAPGAVIDLGEGEKANIQSIVDFVGAVIPIIADFIAGLMPIISELISFLQTYVLPIISELFSFITSTVLPTISAAIQAISPVVTNVLSVLLPAIQTALTTIWNIVAPIIQGILQVVQAVMPVILSVVQSVLGSVQGIIQNLMTVLQGIISFITGVFTRNWSQAWNGIKSIFSGAVGGLGEIIKAPLRAVVSAVNTVIGGLNKLKVPDWVPGLGGKGINIPLIPGFAKGTDRTPSTFIAGENGPELITNAANRKVFTAAQTGQIFNNISQAQTADNVSARMSGAGTIVINVQNSPSVVVNGNGEANNIKQQLEQYDEAFLEKLRAIIVAILKEQKEQEDRVVYA